MLGAATAYAWQGPSTDNIPTPLLAIFVMGARGNLLSCERVWLRSVACNRTGDDDDVFVVGAVASKPAGTTSGSVLRRVYSCSRAPAGEAAGTREKDLG